MFILDGKTLPIDVPFTHNGIQYPANWLRLTTLEEKQAIGITEEPDPESFDDRFYWGLNNPKDLETLQTQWVSQIKDTAGKLLSATDWMIIRKIERNVDVPESISTYRANVVAEATRLELSIKAVTTVEELIVTINTQNWPTGIDKV